MDRTCSLCRLTKPLTAFVRKGGTKDHGYHYICKPCRAAERRAWRAAHPDLRRAERQRYRQAHPEKRRAHAAVDSAVATGRLVRPDACSVCNTAGPVEAHHDDYARRLDVRWLCHTCHEDHHVQLRREAKDAPQAA